MMIFNVRPGGSADRIGNLGWILGLNQAGEFPLNFQFDVPSQDVRSLANGNLLFSQTSVGLIREVTWAGKPVRQWHVAGKYQDHAPPIDSIEIEAELFHHTINIFPNGNLLLLSAEAREYEDWPVDDSDPNAACYTANVVGDVVLEVSPEGKVLNRWPMLDLLDPYRLCYDSCSPYWQARGFTNSNDWCHANAVTFDAADNSIMVSLRTQDCIIKFDRGSGELKWILGDPGNWQQPWSDKLLKPVGKLEWQYHQHDCSVTPSGTILCFDNGNFRATPFAEKMTDRESYSRVVEFAVDEDAMTVEQVWAFGKDPEERLFACYQGGAYRLPQTGNTFMTYGGVCTIDGEATADINNAFAQARLIEVTPKKEIVFDMWIDGSGESEPLPLSSFRAEFVADL